MKQAAINKNSNPTLRFPSSTESRGTESILQYRPRGRCKHGFYSSHLFLHPFSRVFVTLITYRYHHSRDFSDNNSKVKEGSCLGDSFFRENGRNMINQFHVHMTGNLKYEMEEDGAKMDYSSGGVVKTEFETGWALTTVAYWTVEHTRRVLDQVVLPNFVIVLASSGVGVREQVLGVLENVAGEFSKGGDLVRGTRGKGLWSSIVKVSKCGGAKSIKRSNRIKSESIYLAMWVFDPGIQNERGYLVHRSGTRKNLGVQIDYGERHVEGVASLPCVLPGCTRLRYLMFRSTKKVNQLLIEFDIASPVDDKGTSMFEKRVPNRVDNDYMTLSTWDIFVKDIDSSSSSIVIQLLQWEHVLRSMEVSSVSDCKDTPMMSRQQLSTDVCSNGASWTGITCYCCFTFVLGMMLPMQVLYATLRTRWLIGGEVLISSVSNDIF